MQKPYFFFIATIFMATATIPMMCMELSSNTSEKQKLIVKLQLSEITQDSEKQLNEWRNQSNKHAYQVLNIPWQADEKQYKVHFAELYASKNINETPWEWTTFHPHFLPFCTIKKNSLMPYTINFPTILSASFVEKLKEEKCITLKNTYFADPIEIVVELRN